jgi:hypothetical protein
MEFFCSCSQKLKILFFFLSVGAIQANAEEQIRYHGGTSISGEDLAEPKPPVWMPVLDKMLFRDNTDLIWFQFPVNSKVTWVEASQMCRKHGLRLPNRPEVDYIKERLFVEESKLPKNNLTFWLAANPDQPRDLRYTYAAHFHNGVYGYGNIQGVLFDITKLGEIVRCVYQASPPTEIPLSTPPVLAIEPLSPKMK